VILSRKLLGILSAAIAVIGFGGYAFHTRHSASAASAPALTPAAGANLRQVMQTRVHHEYTFMSYTIWHDQPLTDEKMDAIAASSDRLILIGHDLNGYAAVYRQQGWSREDVDYFEEKRVQLTRVAEELKRAAQKHDSAQVTSFFMHLDNTCQSCHRRFRPDLSWT
jgi:cytochrome c556